jgi:hypothetical protein
MPQDLFDLWRFEVVDTRYLIARQPLTSPWQAA